jgi:hypothetical protein
MGGRSNILVTRFNADKTFKGSYDKALTDLKASLYTSGKAASVLEARAAVLTAEASDLISADTVSSESTTIKGYFARPPPVGGVSGSDRRLADPQAGGSSRASGSIRPADPQAGGSSRASGWELAGGCRLAGS